MTVLERLQRLPLKTREYLALEVLPAIVVGTIMPLWLTGLLYLSWIFRAYSALSFFTFLVPTLVALGLFALTWRPVIWLSRKLLNDDWPIKLDKFQ